MNPEHCARIGAELSITEKQVLAVEALPSDNATVPFIARYRKEATGGLDEIAITAIREFREVRKWVHTNRYRFRQDARSVTDLWEQPE